MTLTWLETTESTNADMLALIAKGEAQEGDWVVAERQTSGRGRLGRRWESPSGNLCATTVVSLRPGDPPATTLAFVAGFALWGSSHVSCAELKWPNDLMVGGRKLAGILLERRSDFVVIGFGLNVACAPEVGGRATARVHDFAEEDVTWLTIFDCLQTQFADALAKWRELGFDHTRRCWESEGPRRGAQLVVALPNAATVSGAYEGLNDEGALRLRLASGRLEVVYAGDVQLVETL